MNHHHWDDHDDSESSEKPYANDLLVISETGDLAHASSSPSSSKQHDDQPLLIQPSSEKARSRWYQSVARSLREFSPSLSDSVGSYRILPDRPSSLPSGLLWFAQLPVEVHLHVLSFLDCRDLARFAAVSRECRALALSPILWRLLCHQFSLANCIDPTLILPFENMAQYQEAVQFFLDEQCPDRRPALTRLSSFSISSKISARSNQMTATPFSASPFFPSASSFSSLALSNSSSLFPQFPPQFPPHSPPQSPPRLTLSSEHPTASSLPISSSSPSSSSSPNEHSLVDPEDPIREFVEISLIDEEVRVIASKMAKSEVSRLRRRACKKREAEIAAQAVISASPQQLFLGEGREVDWKLVFQDLYMLPKRKQYFIALRNAFQSPAVLEIDQLLYRSIMLLWRCEILRYNREHRFSHDLLFTLRFYLPPLFPSHDIRPTLRITSARYLHKYQPIFRDYQLRHCANFNGEMRQEIAQCVAHFARHYRAVDFADRLMMRGGVIGRKNTIMRCKTAKLLAGAREYSQELTALYLPYRFLGKSDRAFSHCFRFLTSSAQRESIVLVLDVHCENRMVPWNIHAESHTWSEFPRFDIVKNAIWHFVLAKSAMNRFNRFALVVVGAEAQLVQKFTDDPCLFGQALFSVQAALPPPQAPAVPPFALDSLLELLNRMIRVVYPQCSGAVPSSSHDFSDLDALESFRALVVYGRSNSVPIAPDPSVSSPFYSLAASCRRKLAVTIDVCFIHRTQRTAEREKKVEPFPLEEISRVLKMLTAPLNGYFWSHDSPDALSFSAQLCVLLAHLCQRTPRQSIDARFGRIDEKYYEKREEEDQKKKNFFKRVPW